MKNRFFWFIRKVIILTLLLSVMTAFAIYYYMEHELPDTNALKTVQLQVPLEVFTSDGKIIATFGEKRRIPIAYNDIPKPLINAVLATEDQRYFQHPGVDIMGLVRASIQLVLTGRKTQGASTITMQVARSFYLSPKKTFGRKIREILLAIKIEHQLSKEKILELYLNKIFLGSRAYGVEAAAQVYYGKHLSELSLDQFAVLAGLPKAPSALNPIHHPKAAKKRRNHVLTRMYDENLITDDEYQKATRAPITAKYHGVPNEISAPYVAELVRSQLEQMYGESIYTDGFDVYTTISSKDQLAANKSLKDNLLAYDQRHGYRGSSENFGQPSISNMDDWEDKLRKMPTVNGLEPAAVVEMTRQTITVLRKNGNLAIIPWKGLSWARKQINANYLGARPRRASQIVKVGDVIHISKNEDGSFRLAQVPKAEASLVALDPQNGAILALVGGFDYYSSNFNRATHAERQPGSSFKPFIYSAGLEKGYTLATVLNDAPIVIENPSDNSLWRPQNSNHKFHGPTRLRVGIMKSRNLVSIRLLALVGLPYALNYLQKFGFEEAQLPNGLSLALGTAMVTPLQMAQGFAVFANGGLRVTPFLIDHINNAKKQTIYQAKPLYACTENCPAGTAKAPRAIPEQNAFLITSAMRDVIKHGTGRRALVLKRNDLAGKTGTTQNQYDAWFAGFNPDIVTIAWVGFDQPQSLHEYGAKAALPMWIDFMREALKTRPQHTLEQPPGIVSIRIDPYTGKRATTRAQDAKFEYFMLPHVPDKYDGNLNLPDDELANINRLREPTRYRNQYDEAPPEQPRGNINQHHFY